MLIRFSLADAFLSRPQQEISVCGWLTEVWVEQQPWLTDFFDPAPVELLCSTLRACSAPHSLQRSLIHTRLKPRLTGTQHPILSNLCSLQIHKPLVDCVSRQLHGVKTLGQCYCISQIPSLSQTLYFEVNASEEENVVVLAFNVKRKNPSLLCQIVACRITNTSSVLIIKLWLDMFSPPLWSTLKMSEY